MTKTLAIVAALAAGFLFPQAHAASFLVRYLIVVMLFLAFLGIDFRLRSFEKRHFALLAAPVLIAFAVFVLLDPLGRDLALSASMAAAAPTATAAPVVTGLLGGSVEHVALSVLLSNAAAALWIPALLAVLADSRVPFPATQVLVPVVAIVGIPLVAAQILRRGFPAAVARVLPLRAASFWIWVAALFLIAARMGQFLRHEMPTHPLAVVPYAAAAFALCVINFAVGKRLGGAQRPLESGQALGQKNTILAIWVSMTYLGPLAALVPTFYVLFHNLFNSWQMLTHARNVSVDARRLAAAPGPPGPPSR